MKSVQFAGHPAQQHPGRFFLSLGGGQAKVKFGYGCSQNHDADPEQREREGAEEGGKGALVHDTRLEMLAPLSNAFLSSSLCILSNTAESFVAMAYSV